MKTAFARRVDDLKASEIRELLKITEKPDIISFAGGLPAPELFPVEKLMEISRKVLEEEGMKALQYSATEGYLPLRSKIARRMNVQFNSNISMDEIIITNGSQQGLDFSGKIFLDEGDTVLCESPTYLGAINAFRPYRPRFVEVPTDEHGMLIEELESILLKNRDIKLIYVVPDFQNPTGRTWSLERRKHFIDLITRHEIHVLEDNPYGELRFEGEMLPSLKSLDKEGLVIYLGTFSKIFCPGMRIGWIAADKPIIEKYVLLKQGADLHTSSISQMEISKYLDTNDIDSDIKRLITVYRDRRDTMVDSMRDFFPENVTFNRPQGGLFLWAQLPENINARHVLAEALDCNVAFVPGGSFFPNGGRENTMRLNYSNMPCEKIVEGISRLGGVLSGFM